MQFLFYSIFFDGCRATLTTDIVGPSKTTIDSIGWDKVDRQSWPVDVGLCVAGLNRTRMLTIDSVCLSAANRVRHMHRFNHANDEPVSVNSGDTENESPM